MNLEPLAILLVFGIAVTAVWIRPARIHGHAWSCVRDTGKTVYEQCRTCGERRARQRPWMHGYQPIDATWLETGMWSPFGWGEKS